LYRFASKRFFSNSKAFRSDEETLEAVSSRDAEKGDPFGAGAIVNGDVGSRAFRDCAFEKDTRFGSRSFASFGCERSSFPREGRFFPLERRVESGFAAAAEVRAPSSSSSSTTRGFFLNAESEGSEGEGSEGEGSAVSRRRDALRGGASERVRAFSIREARSEVRSTDTCETDFRSLLPRAFRVPLLGKIAQSSP
jgi:hypothetical protein